jgi:hypothetical protein
MLSNLSPMVAIVNNNVCSKIAKKVDFKCYHSKKITEVIDMLISLI